MIGHVRWFDNKKGFGFISVNEQDYFVHYKNINGIGFKQLRDGQEVSFTPSTTDRGLVATDVHVSESEKV